MGLFFVKLSLMIRKGVKWNLWCNPVKVQNMDTDQLVFVDEMEMNISMVGEMNSDV